jgi:hypothetical protein
MSGTQFTHKTIDVTFSLGKGSFGNSGFNTVKQSGLRMSAVIVCWGSPGSAILQLRIWGMAFDTVNKLNGGFGNMSYPALKNNAITVEGGDAQSGKAVVFQGIMYQAHADFNSMPNASLQVAAIAGGISILKPVPPISFRGSADVATIMSGLATQQGHTFENNNVNVKLSNPYFPGTAKQQAEQLAAHAGINMVVDSQTTPNTLAIWPRGTSRGGVIPLVSPESGMIGYPTFTPLGVVVRTIYNKSIKFGGAVQIQSSIPNACGKFFVSSMTHTLESEIPNGSWETMFEAVPAGTQGFGGQ